MTNRLILTDAEWRKRLTPEQYAVLRRAGTEPAFCGGYSATKHHGAGTYHCVGCGAGLFRTATKFDSGSGWPSFWEPLPGAVGERDDHAHGMTRTEITCARCDGHLGHVFDDGPRPTGRRYCINAICLDFQAEDQPSAAVGAGAAARTGTTAKATFAMGCFWGVEATFAVVKGVSATRVGYVGGKTTAPTYHDVCGGDTDHAEAVEVVFDPAVVSYDQLLEVFWANHDPTTRNRQGPDVGTQYRSVIFTHDAAQVEAARTSLAAHAKAFRRPIVTEIVPAPEFWPAEDYHQKYLEKRGLNACH